MFFSQFYFFFFFPLVLLPIPSLNCSKSLTWMLGKIRVDQRVGRQAGRQGNNHLMFALISVSSPVMTDLTPVQYVLETYLKGICDCF